MRGNREERAQGGRNRENMGREEKRRRKEREEGKKGQGERTGESRSRKSSG